MTIQFIGRYQVEDTIGRGGMGVVYRAFDPMLQRTVALKVINGVALEEGDARERLLREARAAGQLAHRNIVVIHDLGEEHGQPYLAMEYLTGASLEAHLGRGPMPLDRIIDLAVQLCDGLEFAHRRGIVHRDIKPANLFVTDAGELKILDFGLVRLASSSLTRSHSVVGTVSYMAPEQVRGERVDHRVDVFAAGAVLYELVARRKAFEGDSFATTMYKIVQEPPAPLVQSVPDVPLSFVAVVERALAKDPGQRYQSAADMRRDLDGCRVPAGSLLASQAAGAPSHAAAEGALNPLSFRAPLVRSAAIAGAVLIAAGAWFWSSDRRPLVPNPDSQSAPAASVQVTPPQGPDSIVPSAVPVVTPTETPPATAPPPLPAPARMPSNASAIPSGTPVASTAGRQAIAAAALRVEQARSAADAVEARTLAPVQYAAAAALEAETRAAADTAPVADVTARFVEAEARFRAAAIEARAEARAQATPAPPLQTPAVPPIAAPPPAAPAEPRADTRPPAPDGRGREAGAAPGRDTETPDLPPRSPVNSESLVREVVTQYITALEGRSMAALKRVWPTLTGVQERAIQSEFTNARSVQVRFTDSRISVNGAAATVTGTRDYRLVTQDGQQLSTVTNTTLTLRRTGETWHIERIVHQAR